MKASQQQKLARKYAILEKFKCQTPKDSQFQLFDVVLTNDPFVTTYCLILHNSIILDHIVGPSSILAEKRLRIQL